MKRASLKTLFGLAMFIPTIACTSDAQHDDASDKAREAEPAGEARACKTAAAVSQSVTGESVEPCEAP